MSEPEIKNTARYVDLMSRSVVDKMFFAGIVEPDLIVDYGCADGTLLKAYHRMFPGARLIGFDQSMDMLNLASKNCDGAPMILTDRWDGVLNEIARINPLKPAIILSSLFHEAVSYLNEEAFHTFWMYRVFERDLFQYVIFRDMMVSRDCHRESDAMDVARIRKGFVKDMLDEWEEQWGSLSSQHSLIHFLLTCRYIENWKRELQENYLPVDVEKFLSMIPPSHRLIHFDHYTLPFLRESVYKDFGINLADRTHVKLILERR